MIELIDQGEESFYVEFDSALGKWSVYGSETGCILGAFKSKLDAESYCSKTEAMLESLIFSKKMESLVDSPFPDLIQRVAMHARCKISDIKMWSNIRNMNNFPDPMIQKDIIQIIEDY